MKYRIGIDTRMLSHTGIGTYIRGLLLGFSRNKTSGLPGISTFGGERPADFDPQAPHERFHAPIYSLAEQWSYPRLLRQCRLWHSPHYNIPFYKARTRLVITIHDLIHWIYRKDFYSPIQTFYARTMLRRCVAQADHIIAVSRHTRDDLVRYFKADPEKMSVIYEGVSDSFQTLPPDVSPEDPARECGIAEDYFIYVGTIKPHKNILRLVRVFRELKRAGRIKSSLVVIGKKNAKYPDPFRELGNLKTGGGVFYLPEIEPSKLAAFYRRAVALVHPSLYEGFGLTPLESMACGTPVIASRAASIPEVVGDAAVLFHPEDEQALAEALISVEQDRKLRESLRQKGLERVRIFRWEETARKTAEVYERVLALP